jgi:RNase P/RNase MRP subunit p29
MTIAVQALARRKAKEVIDDLDASITITYVRVTPGAHDPVTDTVSTTTSSTTGVKAIETRIVEDDADYLVANTKMKKLIVPYNSLLFEPKPEDYVTIDGVRWNIHKTKTIPTHAIYTLFIREP